MDDPLRWLDDVAARRDREGLTRRLVERGPATSGRIIHEGRSLINFASNDYLGLASDPRVVAAAIEAAREFGWGAGASPLVCGWRSPHQRLAEALAEFEATEAATLFPTGFAANLGAIAALVGPGDAVYADKLDHACLIAGTRLSGASPRVYPHRDATKLGRVLERERERFRRVLIATDGVFSMDGDVAPLPDLADLAERYDATLLVDEAHATGVIGPDGRGSCAAAGVAQRVPVRVGTLSKALGSLGGFVTGDQRLVDHIINHAPSLIYSTALPPAAAAAAHEALRVARAEDWRRARCRALADQLREALRDQGWRVPPADGPIVPLLVADARRAVSLSGRLLQAGFLAPAIRPPTVPRGTARLRLSVTAAHHEADVVAFSAALGRAHELTDG